MRREASSSLIACDDDSFVNGPICTIRSVFFFFFWGVLRSNLTAFNNTERAARSKSL